MKGGITYYMSNNDIVEYIKSLTISELIELISTNSLPTKQKQNDNIVYTTEDLLTHYPMFSRFTLNKAIKEQNLPFYREGHKMFFEKNLVDNWIKEHTSTYNNKNKNRYKL